MILTKASDKHNHKKVWFNTLDVLDEKAIELYKVCLHRTRRKQVTVSPPLYKLIKLEKNGLSSYISNRAILMTWKKMIDNEHIEEVIIAMKKWSNLEKVQRLGES